MRRLSKLIQEMEARWRMVFGLSSSPPNNTVWEQTLTQIASTAAIIQIVPWSIADLEVLQNALEQIDTLAENLLAQCEHTRWFLYEEPFTRDLVGFHYQQGTPDFIGIATSLLWDATSYRNLTDPWGREQVLQQPLLLTGLLEEIAHCWDSRLRSRRSPFASSGTEWRQIEGEPGQEAVFLIPNRKNYARTQEDWASTIVWFLLRPTLWQVIEPDGQPVQDETGQFLLMDGLQQISPERYDFAQRLFQALHEGRL